MCEIVASSDKLLLNSNPGISGFTPPPAFGPQTGQPRVTLLVRAGPESERRPARLNRSVGSIFTPWSASPRRSGRLERSHGESARVYIQVC